MFEKLRFFTGFHLRIQPYKRNRNDNKKEYLDEERYFYICKEVPNFVQINKIDADIPSKNFYHPVFTDLYHADGKYFPLFAYAKLEQCRVNITPDFILTMHVLDVAIDLDDVERDPDLVEFYSKLCKDGYIELPNEEGPEDKLVKEISHYLADKNGT